jgi:ABC-2 type transport system permease protein
LLCAIVFSAALAIFLSAVNVYLRDVQHFVEVLLVALFFSPPIVYSFGVLTTQFHDHAWFRMVYEGNPLVWIVLSFQRCLFGRVVPPDGRIVAAVSKTVPYHVLPTWGALTYVEGLCGVLAASVVMLLVAMLVFGRVEGNFAEEL